MSSKISPKYPSLGPSVTILLLLFLCVTTLLAESHKPLPSPTISAPQTTQLEAVADHPDSNDRFSSENASADPLNVHQFDSSESSAAILKSYERARQLVGTGNLEGAQRLLASAIIKFPESRHLHLQYAEVMWTIYKDSNGGDPALKLANQEILKATALGISNNSLDDGRTLWLASQTLVELHDSKTLDQVFKEALSLKPSPTRYLLYADALTSLGDPRAEDAYLKSLNGDPERAAQVGYGEWLLDHERYRDVLDLIPADTDSYYSHFLRGVALEHLGDLEAAKVEYKKFSKFSVSFPAPPRFRIDNSTLQEGAGIHFKEILPGKAATADQSISGLSYLIYGEALSESRGARRAVGWVVRNRVLRGGLAWDSQHDPYCPGNTNSGSILSDQYASVMCYSGQFDGMCLQWCSNHNTTSCPSTSGTPISDVAYNVYYGFEPDPVSGHCPDGIASGSDACSDGMRCQGSTQTYTLGGGVFFYSPTTGSCPSAPPGSGCTTSNSTVALSTINSGKVCGNSGVDNCFYVNPQFGLGNFSTQYGTCTGTGYSVVTPNIITSGRVLAAHLEGPQGTATNPDFDLILEKLNTSTGQWGVISSSNEFGTVETVSATVASGTYRWRIYCYQGAGAFKIYTRP